MKPQLIGFDLSQLAKVEIIGDVANIAIASVIQEEDGKQPLLITGIPTIAVTSLTAAKLAAAAIDAEVLATIKVTDTPAKIGDDEFYTAAYGGRLILES